MEPAAAKLIGAGLAVIGVGVSAIGVGLVFGNFLLGALRNPSAAESMRPTLLLGFALAESLGIFAFFVALVLLFT